jgi:hypothetical protein
MQLKENNNPRNTRSVADGSRKFRQLEFEERGAVFDPFTGESLLRFSLVATWLDRTKNSSTPRMNLDSDL